MNIRERSLAYITRKKARTLIVLLILSLITSSIYACLSIIRANNDLEKRISKTANSSFSIVKNPNGENIKVADIKNIATRNGINKINYRHSTNIKLENGQVVNDNQKIQMDNPDDNLKNLLKMHSVADSSLENVFTSESFILKEGKHIHSSKDVTNTVLVHEKLATKNKFKLGDEISLSSITSGAKKSNFKIIGIFSGKTQEEYNGLSSDLSENTVFASANDSDTNYSVDQATFFLEQPEKINQIIAEVKKYPLNWSGIDIIKNTKAFENIISAVKTMKGIINIMALGIFFSGVAVLSLVLMLWLRERIYEIGILLAIGQEKIKIIGQFIFELILISIPTIIIATFAGKIISNQLLSGLLVDDELAELSGKLSTNIFGLNNLFDLGLSYVILLAIIFISVMLTSAYILSQKPKKILSKIS